MKISIKVLRGSIVHKFIFGRVARRAIAWAVRTLGLFWLRDEIELIFLPLLCSFQKNWTHLVVRRNRRVGSTSISVAKPVRIRLVVLLIHLWYFQLDSLSISWLNLFCLQVWKKLWFSEVDFRFDFGQSEFPVLMAWRVYYRFLASVDHELVFKRQAQAIVRGIGKALSNQWFLSSCTDQFVGPKTIFVPLVLAVDLGKGAWVCFFRRCGF